MMQIFDWNCRPISVSISSVLAPGSGAMSLANAILPGGIKPQDILFFGGYTRQNRVDVNKDGITDLPHLRAIVFHPRLFFYPDERTTVVTGYTGTFEGREGGDLQVVDGQSDAVHQYPRTSHIKLVV